MKVWLSRLKPFLYVGGLYIVISFILRIIFMGHPITSTSFVGSGLGYASGGHPERCVYHHLGQ